VTSGQLPQRAGSLGLNGGSAAAVPPGYWNNEPVCHHCSCDDL